MGKKDIITKEYIDDPEVFADIFNYLLHGGKKIIDPGNLRPLDTTLVATPYGTDGAVLPVKRIRDSLKCLTAKEDNAKEELTIPFLSHKKNSRKWVPSHFREFFGSIQEFTAGN